MGSALEGKNLLLEEQILSLRVDPFENGDRNENCSAVSLEGVLMQVKKRVKVSHSLISVGAVGVRVPLYLGYS